MWFFNYQQSAIDKNKLTPFLKYNSRACALAHIPTFRQIPPIPPIKTLIQRNRRITLHTYLFWTYQKIKKRFNCGRIFIILSEKLITRLIWINFPWASSFIGRKRRIFFLTYFPSLMTVWQEWQDAYIVILYTQKNKD